MPQMRCYTTSWNISVRKLALSVRCDSLAVSLAKILMHGNVFIKKSRFEFAKPESTFSIWLNFFCGLSLPLLSLANVGVISRLVCVTIAHVSTQCDPSNEFFFGGGGRSSYPFRPLYSAAISTSTLLEIGLLVSDAYVHVAVTTVSTSLRHIVLPSGSVLHDSSVSLRWVGRPLRRTCCHEP